MQLEPNAVIQISKKPEPIKIGSAPAFLLDNQ